jgi:microcompartment protein CcmK/EutM
VGDTVLVMREGNGVRQILGRDQGIDVDQAIKMDVPVRSMIVGIVDHVSLEISPQGSL